MPRRMSDVSFGDVVLPARLVSELEGLPGFLQSACYDMADPLAFPELFKTVGAGVASEFKKEAVADHLYNDVDVMCDLLGDRINDAFYSSGCYPLRSCLWNYAVVYLAGQISHLRTGILERLTRRGPGLCPKCSNPMEYGDEDQEERVCDACAWVPQCA